MCWPCATIRPSRLRRWLKRDLPLGAGKACSKIWCKYRKKQDLVPLNEVAWPSALLGKQIEALRYLNTAYEEWDGALLFVEVYPEFDSLRA